MNRDTKFLGFQSVPRAAVIITALAMVASLGLAACDQNKQSAKQDVKEAPKTEAATETPKANDHLEKLKWVDSPQAAAQTPFTDAEGKTHTLADFAGKVLVVNFWATWCGPCIQEMPTLDKLQADLGGKDFAVVTIDQDREGLKAAQPFVTEHGWKNLPLYVDAAGQFQTDAALRGLPTSIVVDRQGREVARLEGENAWDAPDVEAVIKDQIKKP